MSSLPEPACYGFHYCRGRRRLGQIGLYRQHPPAERAYLLGYLFGLVLTGVVGEADVGSLRRQSAHDLRADSAAAPGDQRHLPDQPVRVVHRGSLSLRLTSTPAR
jgi:hypothetical protein